MQVLITINTDNAAFDGHGFGSELARILRWYAEDCEHATKRTAPSECDGMKKRDLNGNTVAKLEVRP